MKKIVFGILLVFFSFALTVLEEHKNVFLISDKFDAVLCINLLILGLGFGVWGLLGKDR